MTILAHVSSPYQVLQVFKTIVSMPNPCDFYLGQNIDIVLQPYENDGSFENPV